MNNNIKLTFINNAHKQMYDGYNKLRKEIFKANIQNLVDVVSNNYDLDFCMLFIDLDMETKDREDIWYVNARVTNIADRELKAFEEFKFEIRKEY